MGLGGQVVRGCQRNRRGRWQNLHQPSNQLGFAEASHSCDSCPPCQQQQVFFGLFSEIIPCHNTLSLPQSGGMLPSGCVLCAMRPSIESRGAFNHSQSTVPEICLQWGRRKEREGALDIANRCALLNYIYEIARGD